MVVEREGEQDLAEGDTLVKVIDTTMSGIYLCNWVFVYRMVVIPHFFNNHLGRI